jgi:membrane protein
MEPQFPSSDETIEPEMSQAPGEGESAVPAVAAVSSPAALAGATADRVPSLDKDRTDPATAEPLTPKVLALELWHGFFRTGVTGLATQFAYSLLFAIFPLLVLVLSLSALVDRVLDLPVADALRDLIDNSAPDVLKPLLQELVNSAIAEADTSVVSISAVVAIVLAVWGASGAIGNLVTASARAYGVKIARPFVVRRLINAMLAVVNVILIVAAAVLFVFGESITQRVGTWLGGGDEVESIVVVLRWGLIVVCTASALLTLYRVGPKLDLGFVWLLPGTTVATGLWLLLLTGFSELLKVTNPGDPYGAFGSLVVLLWFFYLTGVAFMLGAVINAVVGRPYDKRRRADLARNPEKRLFCDDGTEL